MICAITLIEKWRIEMGTVGSAATTLPLVIAPTSAAVGNSLSAKITTLKAGKWQIIVLAVIAVLIVLTLIVYVTYRIIACCRTKKPSALTSEQITAANAQAATKFLEELDLFGEKDPFGALLKVSAPLADPALARDAKKLTNKMRKEAQQRAAIKNPDTSSLNCPKAAALFAAAIEKKVVTLGKEPEPSAASASQLPNAEGDDEVVEENPGAASPVKLQTGFLATPRGVGLATAIGKPLDRKEETLKNLSSAAPQTPSVLNASSASIASILDSSGSAEEGDTTTESPGLNNTFGSVHLGSPVKGNGGSPAASPGKGRGRGNPQSAAGQPAQAIQAAQRKGVVEKLRGFITPKKAEKK